MPTCSKCSDADLGRVCPHRQTLLITAEALDNFYAWVREAQQLRSTLADLIAELRAYARYTYTEYTLIENALDRAETRLMSLNKGHKDTDPVQCDARNAMKATRRKPPEEENV